MFPSSEAMFLMRRKWLVIDLSIVNQKDYPITHKKKCRKDYLAAKYAEWKTEKNSLSNNKTYQNIKK